MTLRVVIVCHYTECHYSKGFGAKLPQRGRDGVLELEPSWLSVDLQRHQVNLSVVEFDPAEKVKKTFQSESVGQLWEGKA